MHFQLVFIMLHMHLTLLTLIFIRKQHHDKHKTEARQHKSDVHKLKNVKNR